MVYQPRFELADLPDQFQAGRETAVRNRLNDLRMQETEQQVAREQGVRDKLGELAGLAPEQRPEYLNELSSMGPEGLDFSTQIRTMWEGMDDRQKAEFEAGAKRASSTLAQVNDQESYTMARNLVLRDNPQLAEQIPEEYDPEFVEIYRNQYRTIEDILGGGASTPAGLREFESLTNYAGIEPGTPEMKRAASARLGLESKAGASRIYDIGGAPHYVTQGPSGPVLTPLSTLKEEADAAGAIKESEAAGSKRGALKAEKEMAAPRAKAAIEAAEAQAMRVSDMIDDVIPRVNALSAGPAAALSWVGGSAPKNVKSDIDSIRANIGFDRLEAMKKASPTGGALGQVTEREIEFLQAVLGSLEQSQSPAQLRRNLGRAKAEIQASFQRMRDSYEDDYGTTEGAPGADVSRGTNLSPEDQQALQWATQNPNDPRAQQIRQSLGQ